MILTPNAPEDGLGVFLFRQKPVSVSDGIHRRRVKRSHFVGRRAYESADPNDFEDDSPFIPDEYILAVVSITVGHGVLCMICPH